MSEQDLQIPSLQPLKRLDGSEQTQFQELVGTDTKLVQTDPNDPFYVEEVPKFPALEPLSDTDFKYQDFSLGKKDSIFNLNTLIRGVRIPTSRNREVANKNLLTPIFKTQDFYDLTNKDDVEVLNDATGFRNKDNVYFPLPGANDDERRNIPLEQKLNFADRVQATQVSNKYGETMQDIFHVDIPFAKALTREIALPRGLQYDFEVPDFLKSSEQRYGKSPHEVYIQGGADPELTKIFYARLLNENLIKQGVKDTRTRLAIIMNEKNLGSRLDVMASDLAKIGGRVKEAIKFPFQMASYIGGEVLSTLIGMDDKPDGITDSEWRHQFFEKNAPEYAAIIQDRFAQMNISMDFNTAQYLAGYYSGIGTQTIGLATEIAVPSKMAMRIKALYGKGTEKDLQKYVTQQTASVKDGGKGRKVSMDVLLAEFIAKKEDRVMLLTSPLLAANVFRVSNLTKPVADGAEKIRVGINRIFVSNRIQAGMQLKDAGKIFAGSRAEVAALVKSRMDLRKQRDALKLKAKQQGANPDLNKDIKELDDQIQAVTTEAQIAISRSQTPKFMREANVQNKFMILGGASMAQLFQQYNLDPQMGEMAGIFTGLFLTLGSGTPSTGMSYVRNNLMGGSTTKKATFNFAQELAKKVNTFSPEFRAAVLERMKYFENLQQVLVQELKIPPRLVQSTFAKISGLSYLQLLEESTRLNIKAKELVDFKKLEELTSVKNLQQELIAELRTGLETLTANDKINTIPEGAKLLRVVQEALKDADSSVKQLEIDIKHIGDFAEGRISDLINDRTGKETFLDPSSSKAFDSAIENIGISKTKLIPSSQLNNIKKELFSVDDKVNKEVIKLGNKLLGAAPLGKAIEKTEKALDIKLDKNIYDDSSNLAALLLESNKGTAKNVASLNYNVLNDAKFVDANGQFIGANATTDGLGVFTKLVDQTAIVDDTYFFKILNASGGVPTGTQTKLFNLFDGLADGYIREYARKNNLDYDEVISSSVEALVDKGSYNKNLSRALNVVRDLQANAPENFVVRALPLTFNQIKEFRSALSHLSYKATQAGNDNAARIYNQLDGELEGALNNFTVKRDDGTEVDIGQLFVKRNGETVSAKQVLDDANNDWSDYKNRFYFVNGKGNKTIATWMGRTGSTSRTHNSVYNKENPTGIEYGPNNKPRSWFKMGDYIKMDEASRATVWDEMQRGFGVKQTKDNQYNPALHGTYKIDYSTDKGKAFSAMINNKVANYLIEQTKNKKDIDYNKLINDLDSLSNFFMGTDNQGNTKSLVNLDKIFKEKFEYKQSTVGEKYFNTGEQRKNNAVKFNVNRLKQQGAEIKQGIIDAKKILEKYDPERIRVGDISDVLFENGGIRLESFKESLNEIRKRAGKKPFSDQQINLIYENVLLDTIDTQVFIPTGRIDVKANRVNPEDPLLIPETTIDLEKMKMLIGYGDKAKAQAIENIVGEKRYKVYKSMVELLENEKKKPFDDVSITGIPRAFSVESWISRFYAIQRNVIGIRYVGTEAILQQMRISGMKTMRAMLADPEAATLFMKVLKSGKPLNATEEKAFFNAMVTQFATWETHANVLTNESFDDNVKAFYMPPITGGKKFKEFKTPFRKDDYVAKTIGTPFPPGRILRTGKPIFGGD
jgi:hypothetical protein